MLGLALPGDDRLSATKWGKAGRNTPEPVHSRCVRLQPVAV